MKVVFTMLFSGEVKALNFDIYGASLFCVGKHTN